jgi:tetratricopeptide (TPR) repeat protein
VSRFQHLELDSSKPLGGKPDQAKSPSPAPTPAENHDANYWLKLADQNRCRGSFEDALREYSRAVELDRSLIPAWIGQVRSLISLSEFPEAELWARKALELFKNNPGLLAAQAQALCRVGNLKDGQASCDAALHQPGQLAYPFIARADLMLARKDKETVEEYCFDKAAQIDPHWSVQLDIAEVYIYYHRNAKALLHLQQALNKAPDQPYVWFLQGQCESAMGMADAAIRSFKQCLDLDPKFPGAEDLLNQVQQGGNSWLKRFLKR